MSEVVADVGHEPPVIVRDLVFVLTLASGAGGRADDERVITGIVDRVLHPAPLAPADPFYARLLAAARLLGLEVTEVRASWSDAVTAVSPRSPLFQLTADGPVAVVERRGHSTRVLRSDGTATWVADTPDRLAAPLQWLVIERALTLQHHHDDHPTPVTRLYALLREEREDLLVLLAYAALVAILSLAIPVATQVLVNTVAFGTVLQPILVISVLLMAALGFTAVMNVLSFVVVEHLQRRTFVRVTADLVRRLPRIRIEALDGVNGPELVNRFFDVLTVQKSLASLLLDGVALVMSAVVGLALLAVYHPIFLGFDLLLVVLVTVVLVAFGRGAVGSAIEESKAKYDVASWIEELARHPLAFKVADELAARRGDDLAHTWLRARAGHFRRLLGQIAGLHALYALVTGLLFALGGWLVIRGQLTLGQLVAAELVVATVLGTFRKFAKQLDALYDLLAALDKLGYLLDLPLERMDGETPVVASGPVGVGLHDVRLALEEGPALDGVGIQLAPGDRVGITGRSGSGKTLLLHLMAGLRAPASGCVRWDGVDLRDLRLGAVRRDLALVGGIEIVDGTLLENVAMGRGAVGMVDVRRALVAVGLLDAVSALPQGLRTRLLPGGAPLTRGQQARLMLARAIAGSPRLLLVDDLLDALGPEDLAPALDALLGADRPATVVVVSRNAEVLGRTDRIHSLDARVTA